MSRHYKILEVAPEIVAGLCRGTYHVCANEIPDRTAVVPDRHAWHSHGRKTARSVVTGPTRPNRRPNSESWQTACTMPVTSGWS